MHSPRQTIRFAGNSIDWRSDYRKVAAVCVGPETMDCERGEMFRVPVDLPPSPIKLWHHLAIKLVLNIVSTATMARMGRVFGNWMVHVETTNKKLIDRGTRLIAELSGLGYEDACLRLHETNGRGRISPATYRQCSVAGCPGPGAIGLHAPRQPMRSKYLPEHGIEPVPDRKGQTTRKTFLKVRWNCLAAIDFTTVEFRTKGGLVLLPVVRDGGWPRVLSTLAACVSSLGDDSVSDRPPGNIRS